MPRGGYRPKLESVPMEELDCCGAGALKRPHKFNRPIGSHQRQCDQCWQASISIRVMAQFHDERGQR